MQLPKSLGNGDGGSRFENMCEMNGVFQWAVPQLLDWLITEYSYH